MDINENNRNHYRIIIVVFLAYIDNLLYKYMLKGISKTMSTEIGELGTRGTKYNCFVGKIEVYIDGKKIIFVIKMLT